MPRCIEVRLPVVVDSDELAGILCETGLAGSWESGGLIHLFWEAGRWKDCLADEIREALALLGGNPGTALEISELPDRDWNAAWASSVEPIVIGGRVLIHQSWNSAPVPPGGFAIVLDPKRAFGTGYHATTQLLIEWLLDNVTGGEHVLDAGTGSGVLAMTALRLGAASALGIDLDPEAIECAVDYAALNGFGQELALRVTPLSELQGQRFDIITANLDRETLLRSGGGIVALLSPRGRLALTGIQQDDVGAICGVLSAAGARSGGRRERGEWVALDFCLSD